MNVNRGIDLFFLQLHGIIFFTVIRQESKNDIDYLFFI